MITKQDLVEAIAECQGQRSPNANTAVKLAAFYTILDHIEDNAISAPVPPSAPVSFDSMQSFASAVDKNVSAGIRYSGDSAFLHAISGRPEDQVFGVMDELMNALKITNPRLYEGVMRKLESISTS